MLVCVKIATISNVRIFRFMMHFLKVTFHLLTNELRCHFPYTGDLMGYPHLVLDIPLLIFYIYLYIFLIIYLFLKFYYLFYF